VLNIEEKRVLCAKRVPLSPQDILLLPGETGPLWQRNPLQKAPSSKDERNLLTLQLCSPAPLKVIAPRITRDEEAKSPLDSPMIPD